MKKILEKIMLDLDGCISKRETIYNKFAARNISSKGKNENKRKFVKKINDIRINIKTTKIVNISYYY